MSTLTFRTRLARFGVVLCVLAALAASLASTARAAGYWNVWQADLPDSNGVRTKHTVFGGGSTVAWVIRLSWTSGTHDMHFTIIGHDGTWTNLSAESWGGEIGYYDRYLYYTSSFVQSGVAEAGCQNPLPLSTVWTNCRNAASY